MPVGNNSTAAKPGSRLRELGLTLPKAPTPLGANVEASEVGSRGLTQGFSGFEIDHGLNAVPFQVESSSVRNSLAR